MRLVHRIIAMRLQVNCSLGHLGDRYLLFLLFLTSYSLVLDRTYLFLTEVQASYLIQGRLCLM